MTRERSKELFERARAVIPGGVNSPVRAFRSVSEEGPFFVERGEGAYLYDVDGNRYLDHVCSWGPLIFGHNPPGLAEALDRAVRRGTSYGAATALEVELAELIVELVPGIEQVRLVSSGTEATMSAIRLARGITGRPMIIKCEGCYHGHGDSFLVKAGSGGATFGVPDSAGVPAELSRLTLNVQYNDADELEDLLRREGWRVAAVILEPVAANMGVVPPAPGYLQRVRELTRRQGVLLVFDEVITGFRLGTGGAQEHYGVTPDLTCLGKIIGGGLPIGAYGGPRELMEQVSPLGPVYQAGTLSGNPVAVTAGLYTLRRLRQERPYDRLEALGAELEAGLRRALERSGQEGTLNRVGSMLTLFFTSGPVRNWQEVSRCDRQKFARYFRLLLDRGIFVAPSQFEACFVSLPMTGADLASSAEAAAEALAACAEP